MNPKSASSDHLYELQEILKNHLQINGFQVDGVIKSLKAVNTQGEVLGSSIDSCK